MKKNYLLILLILVSIYSYGQIYPEVNLPAIDSPLMIVPQDTIYIDFTNGDDINDGQSISTPVKTFSKAISLCPYGVGNNGQSYSEIAILPGNYLLNAPLKQYHNQYYQMVAKSGGGYDTMYRNISVRGIGDVVLNGVNLTITSGGGIVELMGSNIYLKNLHITNSTQNGARFNDSVSLWVDPAIGPSFRVAYHDILVENVTISNVAYFAIHFIRGNKIKTHNSRFYNNCLVNENRAVQLTTGQLWPSALKCQFSRNVTFSNNIVYQNWGEGLNFNKSSHCSGYGNKAWDNFSINFYLDHASNTILKNNLLFNTTDTTFWIADTDGSAATHKYGTMNISIGGEPYSNMGGYQNSINNFIYNNICLNGGLRIGGTHSSTTYPYVLTHKNVWVCNNLLVGFQGEPMAVQRVLSFADSFGIYDSEPTYYDSVHVYNNIISIDTNQLQDYTDELSRTTSTPLPSKLFYGNNMWIRNPTLPSRYTIYNSITDTVNNYIPYSIDTNNINVIYNPYNNNTLKYNRPIPSFLSEDFNGSMRNTSMSNVGPFEYTTPLLLKDYIKRFSLDRYDIPHITLELQYLEEISEMIIFKSNSNQINWEKLYETQKINQNNLIVDNPYPSTQTYYKAIIKTIHGEIITSPIIFFKPKIEGSRTISRIKIYPNPVKDMLTLENTNSSEILFHITSITGKKIIEGILLPHSQKDLCIEGYSKGIFFINTFNNCKLIQNEKVVFQ